MSLAKETESARDLLGRGLLAHLPKALWWSALLTAFLALVSYFSNPAAFDMADVWVTFVAVFVMFAVIIFLGLLLAVGKYRKRPRRE
jgi:L-asparagine transporter-like permease